MAQKISNMSNQSLEEFNDSKEGNSEVDFSIDDSGERKAKRKDSKRLFTKKEPKDKGYSNLNADNSQESIFLMNNKTSKKSKQDGKIGLFKKNSTKEEKKVKEVVKDVKEPEITKRIKVEKRKKVKERENGNQNIDLFGETLENSVIGFPCNDGINIPYPIRMCFDIIEEKGLECEGIYRRIRNKSQIDSIYEAINKNFESKLDEINADPLIAGSIIKKFFRELKMPLINDDLLNLFEKCEQISDKDVDLKIHNIRKILKKMPSSNRDTFSFLIVHLSKIMQKSEINKMDIQNIVLTFQSIVRVKDRLFKFILRNSNLIFKDFRYRKYRNKVADDTITRLSLLPENVQDLENEIANQEKLLYELHSKIAKNEKDKKMQEQLLEELWAVQRYVTSLKRKVKKLKSEQKINNDIQVIEVKKVIIDEKSNTNDLKKPTNIINDEKDLDNEEAKNKEELIKIISENETLVETLQLLFEKLSKEKVKIFDLQQQQNKTFGINKPNNQLNENINYDFININDLQRNYEILINENKQLEDKINVINQKINQEKEKIFELKSIIKYNDFKNEFNQKSQQQEIKINSPNIKMTQSMIRIKSPLQIISSLNKVHDRQTPVENGVSTKL